MRLLAALVLLVMSSFGHAALTICSDGINYAAAANECPAYRTTLSVINIDQTSATITGIGDAQTAGSTHYYYVSISTFPPGCTSLNYAYADLASGVTAERQAAEKARQKCANFKTMIAGTAATSSGSTSVPSAGQFSLSMTGLTQGSNYYVHEFHRGGVAGAGKTSLMSTQAFTTTADTGGGPPPEPGEQAVADSGAAPRYIGTGGSDASDGLTHATRWLTLSKVTGALPTGTNVGLFSSTTFTNQELLVSYAGTAGDRNIIGTYKLNGSSVPIWINDGTFGTGSTDTKAIMSGGLTAGCLSAGSCAYANTFPIDTYDYEYNAPLQVFHTADYTTLLNIDIRLFRYRTLIVGDSYSNTLYGVIVDGVDVHDGGDNPYWVGNNGAVVRNMSLYNLNTCKQQRNMSGSTGSTAACTYGGWPGGLQIISSEQVLVEWNFVRDIFGEGINSYQDSNYVVIRNNTVGDVHSVGIYVDQSAHTVIEGNIIVFDEDGQVGTANAGGSFRGGIWVDYEHFGGALGSGDIRDQVIRNNLVVNAGRAIYLGMWAETIAADSGLAKLQSGYVYGNTVVGSTSYDHSLNEYTNPGARLQYWYAKNNAHWSQGLGAAACTWRDSASTDATYNHWYAVQTDTDCNGAGDSDGVPGLTVSTYATWQAYTIASPPTWANANPAGGSDLLGTGTALSSSILDIANFSIFSQIREVIAGTLTESEWECALCVDAEGTTRASPPSKGAVE